MATESKLLWLALSSLLPAGVLVALLWSNQVSFTFSAAGTQDVRHGLGRQPTGYTLECRTAYLQVWDGGTPTSEVLPLTSSGAGTFLLRI